MPKDTWRSASHRAKYGPVGKLKCKTGRKRKRPPKRARRAAASQTCPECSAPMAARLNRKSGKAFLGCTRYPLCKGTRDVKKPCLPEVTIPSQQAEYKVPRNEYGEAVF